MLDVHPPHEAAHSWRDFFIHIATIVVGLLIAVGLEQSVESIHHRHQRLELEESLHTDTEKAVQDLENQQKDMAVVLHGLDARIGQIQDALDRNHPLAPPLSQTKRYDQELPDDPAWKAAKSGGLIELLPQDDIKAFSEVDTIIASLMQLLIPSDVVLRQRVQLEWRFERNGATIPDFSHASRQDLEEYLNALLAIKADTDEFTGLCGELLGAERAVLQGERDLNRIQQAETSR
jgi:hypothetical protein